MISRWRRAGLLVTRGVVLPLSTRLGVEGVGVTGDLREEEDCQWLAGTHSAVLEIITLLSDLLFAFSTFSSCALGLTQETRVLEFARC